MGKKLNGREQLGSIYLGGRGGRKGRRGEGREGRGKEKEERRRG